MSLQNTSRIFFTSFSCRSCDQQVSATNRIRRRKTKTVDWCFTPLLNWQSLWLFNRNDVLQLELTLSDYKSVLLPFSKCFFHKFPRSWTDWLNNALVSTTITRGSLSINLHLISNTRFRQSFLRCEIWSWVEFKLRELNQTWVQQLHLDLKKKAFLASMNSCGSTLLV